MVYRTYSSQSLPRDSPITDDDGYDFIVGDRVYVDGNKPGTVAYVGEVKFAVGDWAGVALEGPLGKHNGTVHGTEYFQCEPLHGVFVRMHRLSRYPTGTTTTSSRIRYKPSTNLGEDGRSSRRSALKSPMSTSNYDMNPSNWYNTSNYDDSYQSRSLSRDSYDVSRGYKSQIYSPDGKSTVEHKFSSSRTPTPTYDRQKYSSLRRQSSALTDRSPTRTSDNTHMLTPKTKFVADEYVPTYRRAPTPDSSLRLGSRVVVNSSQGVLTGILRYVGQTSFASGEWAGVELDEPVGKNDGSVMGRRYFICPKNYGLFAPIFKVSTEYSSPAPRYTSTYKTTARSGSSLSGTPKPIRRPIFTSTTTMPKTISTTTPKSTTIRTVTTKTRNIPITPPLRRHKSSLSRMTPDFDDFEIERLTPSSPKLDNYYSSSKNTSTSYSSHIIDHSEMY